MALTITTVALLGGTASMSYGPATLNANGGSTPYMWSWSEQAGSTLPAGLSIKTNADNNGSISGIPTAAGSFQVTITVNGSAAGQTANLNLKIVIAAVVKNLMITTTSLPPGTVSTNYGPGGAGAVLTASGTSPYTWSWASQGGSTRVGLPSGLAISPNSDGTGLISGVPSGLGTFQVIAFVKDSAPTPGKSQRTLQSPPAHRSPALRGLRLCVARSHFLHREQQALALPSLITRLRLVAQADRHRTSYWRDRSLRKKP